MVADDKHNEVSSNYIIADFNTGGILPRSVPRDKIYLSVNVPLSRRQAELFGGDDIAAIIRRLDHVQPGPLPSGSASGSQGGSGAYAVHSICDTRGATGPNQEFLVRWEGYEEASWEPSSVFDPSVARELLRRLSDARKPPGPRE